MTGGSTVNIQAEAGANEIIKTGITAGYQRRKLPIKCSNDNFNDSIITQEDFSIFSFYFKSAYCFPVPVTVAARSKA
jgi:hypothetical protein